MVDPDDPDREEGDDVRGVAGPLLQQFVSKLARPRRGHFEVKHQKRDRDREDAVGEGLETIRAHPGVFGGTRRGPAPARAPYPVRMASPEAKNLEAISQAIDQHNANCPFPAAEVRMNPFEVERLGWDHIRGLPVIPDAEIGTGRFRIVCSRDLEDDGLEITEAVGQELETVTPVQN